MQPELGHSLLQKSLHVGMPGSSSLVFISITLRHILNGPRYGERARTFDLGLHQFGISLGQRPVCLPNPCALVWVWLPSPDRITGFWKVA